MKNAIAVGAVVWALATIAEGQGAAPPDGSMQALVAEIRALRADVNRVASASIKSNLLFGRLQLQEQRTIALSRQLDTVQNELGDVAQERASMEDNLRVVNESTTMKPEQREELLAAIPTQLKDLQRREQQLRQRESALSAQVADEQARWTDFSSRLDELERALTTRDRQ